MKTIFLLCTLIGVLCGHSLAAGKPTIIVFLSDDHGMLDSTPCGSADLGCYGSEIPTPHLDALATNGVRFTQFQNTGRRGPLNES